MKKRLLYDLFCSAGGTSTGYSRAGFEVVGVDIRPQPNFPFRFIRMDAIEFLERYLRGEFPEADAFAASPPCQGYSVTNNIWKNDNHPMLIESVRKLLEATGKPYAIENVPGAPLRDPVELTGMMFGLRVIRKRLFELSFFVLRHPPAKRPPAGSTNANAGYSSHANGAQFISVAGHNFSRADGAAAMGIDWPMTRQELSQAIPPAYTNWVGERLMEVIR